MRIIHKILKYKYILLVILITLPGIIPLLHSGLPPTHDGEYHVIRFHQFYKTLSSGILYPRWAADLNNSLGIPLFNYVYPFPNYIASLLHFLGFSFIDSFKLNLFIGTLVGAISMYIFARHYWGNLGGLVSAVSYAYVPYRFVDIYIRGSVGEIWALAFFPAFLWSITKLYEKNSSKFIIISGILFALIIFSHNILTVMFLFFAFIYCLFLLSRVNLKKQFFKSVIISAVLGISLSAIFWLPALAENKYVKGLQIYSIKENFPEVYQLIIPSWGSGFSGSNTQNQMSFQIGLIPILIVILSIFSLNKFRQKNPKALLLVIFFLIWFFISIFFMLRISYFLWLNIPLLNYFQFPWRFLSMAILPTSFLSGGIIYLISSSKLKLLASAMLIILTIIVTLGYTKPAYYHDRDDQYYITRSNFIDGTNSPGDLFNTIWIDKSEKMSEDLIYLKGSGEITNIYNGVTYKKYILNSDVDSELQAKIAYFPGWSIFQDGLKQKASYTRNGILTFASSKGTHTIEILFIDTIIRQIANLITITSLALLIFVLLKNLFKQNLL